MSFRCEKCREPQPVHSRPVRIVLESRRVEYRQAGFGSEIVREGVYCKDCAAAFVATPSESQ